MSANHNNDPHASKDKRSVLRFVANLAWLLGAGSILASSMLDLSASGRNAANVFFGLAFFVFFLCVVAGIARAARHRRDQAKADLTEDPRRPSEGA
jgi:cbb3-type cytochrome oxidase subunit 3